ncbi:hypothetical protein AYI68_g6234 [Smittium mucronatum]|uniref:Uncharacterized protein n=1 Tax=Smittium mucronatum TaxID=133383 RepID=A0A1R0GRP5_9FUNG|nr:hypothetical protein AYI68_g6372 [Smittium mucronatum]OLY79688.1 hypothetical protein AYI68_g6234 [Smittium mucronatum]
MFSYIDWRFELQKIITSPREYAFSTLITLGFLYLLVTRVEESMRKHSLERGNKKKLLDEQSRKIYLKLQQKLSNTGTVSKSSDDEAESTSDQQGEDSKKDSGDFHPAKPQRPSPYSSNLGKPNIRRMDDINRQSRFSLPPRGSMCGGCCG